VDQPIGVSELNRWSNSWGQISLFSITYGGIRWG
jgi:hypothetical protein